MTQADPDDAGAFQRPRGRSPAAVERERDRQRAEHDAQRQERFGQQLEVAAVAAPQRHRQAGIEQAGGQRRERQAEVEMLDQAVLQAQAIA